METPGEGGICTGAAERAEQRSGTRRRDHHKIRNLQKQV